MVKYYVSLLLLSRHVNAIKYLEEVRKLLLPHHKY